MSSLGTSRMTGGGVASPGTEQMRASHCETRCLSIVAEQSDVFQIAPARKRNDYRGSLGLPFYFTLISILRYFALSSAEAPSGLIGLFGLLETEIRDSLIPLSTSQSFTDCARRKDKASLN